MIYIAIDDSSKEAKAFLELLKLEKFAHIYKEPNSTTKKAIEDAISGKTKKASSAAQLFKDLAS